MFLWILWRELNVRIDEEEKKKARITRRVMRNVRRNWKQYTAAAACFVLVVVTANSNMFVDKMNGNDDGVIQEETVVTDSDGNTAVSTTAADSGCSRQCGRKINRQYLKKRLKTLFPKIKQLKSTSSFGNGKAANKYECKFGKSSVVANNSKSSAPSVSQRYKIMWYRLFCRTCKVGRRCGFTENNC